MKTLLNVHSDLDGCGGWLVADYFNVYYDEVLICNYDRFEDANEFNHMAEFEKVIMIDYSVSAEIVQKLLDKNIEVKILDHHANPQTALLQDIKNDKFEYVFDNTKSGTLIAYEYFKPKNARTKKIFLEMVRLIDTYDLFKKNDPLWEDAQNMNRVLYGCLAWGADTPEEQYQFIKDYWFNKLKKFDTWTWTDFEQKKIKSAVDKENKQFNESKACLKKYEDERGVKYGITVAKSKVSIVALRLMEENPDIRYIIMINTYTGKWEKLSLRSRAEDNFSCNQFEKCKGHDCAAGGEVDQDFAAKLYKGQTSLKYKELLVD